VPVLPVANTLKKIERDAVLKTVDRTGLVEVQTPQAFLLEDILEAYRRHGPGQATDDCRIFESAGWKVVTVPGSVFNFKVTWPEDILLFRILEEAHVQDRLRR
jgi:2-C-methyl-D-erythritol 4-phosphate cytidylyltransferase